MYIYIYIHIVNFVIENYYRNFCFSHVHAISKIINLSFYNTISWCIFTQLNYCPMLLSRTHTTRFFKVVGGFVSDNWKYI